MTEETETTTLKMDSRRRFMAYCAGLGVSSTLLSGALWAQAAAEHADGKTLDITLEMLKAAQKIAGVEFSDAELTMMLPDVNQDLERIEKQRTIPLPNSVPTCLHFSPIVPGMKFETQAMPLKMSK